MTFSMSQASLPSFEISLNALSAILDKAAAYATAKKIDPAVLRLAGVEPPRYEDNETTIDQLKERLARTVAYLKTLDHKEIDSSADREITFPLGPTNKGHMKGDDYLNHFLLPNFHFHVTAAYAILRHYGVDIGKSDYLGAIPMKTT